MGKNRSRPGAGARISVCVSAEPKPLQKSLKRALKQERAVRYVRISGRALFLFAVLLFAVVLVRSYARQAHQTELLPVGPIELLLVVLGLVGGGVLLLRALVFFRAPGLPAVARHADRKLELDDLLVSGLAAEGLEGPFAREVVRRAAVAIEDVDPGKLYPARLPVFRTLARIPLVLAAVYFLGLPSGTGLLPSPDGPGKSAAALPNPDRERAPDEEAGEEETEPEGEEEAETPPEEAVPDKVLVRLVPAKKVFEPTEPVMLFVAAKPGDPMASPHTFEVTLVIDETPGKTGRTLTVKPGEEGGDLLGQDAKMVPGLLEKLKPGKHTGVAVLVEDGQVLATEPVEFEIRGDPDNSSQPQPKPEPDPSGGTPPPPKIEAVTRFAVPLFREGETRRKKGWALVPDPDAPAGSPPRRLPLAQAAREAASRPETDVFTERVREEDRETVSRYFDLLRSSK